jgi:hypothetical protein
VNLLLPFFEQKYKYQPVLHTSTMSSTENPFPLASESYHDSAPSTDSGTEAGASGDSSGNSVSISQGGMIAIIVVVVVVSIIGSMYSVCNLLPHALTLS